MEFTVNKSDLVRELGLSQGVVEKKTTIPILSNVLLEASSDGLTLTATDLDLGIRSRCPAKVKRPGAGTIPAKKLLDYVRLLPDAEITIKFQDNHWASITCGRSRTRIAGMSRESYPELPAMPSVVETIASGQLVTMISRTAFAISLEESRFTLNGALLQLRESTAVMVSTDGHRLAYTESPLEAVAERSFRALIPKKAMAEIVKLSPDPGSEQPIHIAGDDNHLFFQVGDRLLISRKLTGNFPDYERVLPKEGEYVITLNRDEVKASVERVAQFADERSHAITVAFVPGEVRFAAKSVETGESEESVTSEYTGPEMAISFNAVYLLDFLKAISQEQFQFELKDPKSAGELRPAGGNMAYLYRYVVMPMRV